MYKTFLCLSILSVLLCGADALKHKEQHGSQDSSDTTPSFGVVGGMEASSSEPSQPDDPSEANLPVGVDEGTEPLSGEPPQPDGFQDSLEVDISAGVVEWMKPLSSEPYHEALGVAKGEGSKLMKPTLFFIGHAYSGSTTLSYLMAKHPEMSFGDTKEHQYFTHDYKKIRSDKKYNDYLEEFWVHCNTTVAYDATMDYINVPEDPEALKYMARRLGNNVKFMYMIRDPLDLIWHDYCHESGDALVLAPPDRALEGQEIQPFDINQPVNLSDRRSVLNTQYISQYLTAFPNKKNWLFIDSDEYFDSPREVLKQVFEFSGVPDMEINLSVPEATGRRRCTMKPTLRERKAFWSLKDNKDEKKLIEKLTGLKFRWRRF